MTTANKEVFTKNHVILFFALVCVCLKSNVCCTCGLGVKILQIIYASISK